MNNFLKACFTAGLMLALSRVGAQAPAPVKDTVPGTKIISTRKNSNATLKPDSSAKLLSEVIVQGQRKDIEMATDKKIFSIENNLAGRGGTVIDALRQIPSVLISADGKISMRDGIPVILVDGKRTSLNLNQIPADQVQSIELITNPSAKYDAQGNRGFINIIMKTNRKIGIAGALRSSVNTQGAYAAGMDINAGTNKINISANYFNRQRTDINSTSVNRFSEPAQNSFVSERDSKGTEYFQRGKIGVDYFKDSSNTFNIDADIAGGHEDYLNQQKTIYTAAAGSIDSSARRINPVRDNFNLWHANFNYTHRFSRENEKLTMYAGWEEYSQSSKGIYNMQYFSKNGSPRYSPLLQDYFVDMDMHMNTWQLDYSRPSFDKESKLEAGIKVTLHSGNNTNLLHDYNYDSLAYLINRKASYTFLYSDPTYALYGNYTGQWGHLGYIAGLRIEKYDYHGKSPNDNNQVSYSNTGFFPGIFLSWKLTTKARLQLNYSRRVRRPVFQEISPIIDYADPQNLRQGNRNLKPEYTNLFEFVYNVSAGKTTVASTLYFRNSTHFIATYSSAISADTLLSTYVNAKTANSYGEELIVKTRPAKFIDITTSVNVLYTAIRNAESGKAVSNNGFSWFGKLTAGFKLAAGITLQCTGNYLAPRVIPQGRTLSSGSLDLSIGKYFMKNKALSVDGSLFDVFNTTRDKTAIESGGYFSQTILNKPQSRIARISISYRFKK
jgi:outer membrane receptor protein involved in Fe transport